VDDGSDVYYDGAEDVGAYCTAKLTFSKIFTSKFGVRIIFKFLRQFQAQSQNKEFRQQSK